MVIDRIFDFLPELVSGLLGGGLVAVLTIPEKKASARLDNAERVVKKYEEILARYERRITELEQQVKELEEKVDRKDERISELEDKLRGMERKRNSKGQFIKQDI